MLFYLQCVRHVPSVLINLFPLLPHFATIILYFLIFLKNYMRNSMKKHHMKNPILTIIFVFGFISLICFNTSECIPENGHNSSHNQSYDCQYDQEIQYDQYNQDVQNNQNDISDNMTDDYMVIFSNSDINNAVVMAKYYIKKKKYEKAIDLINKKLKKYLNYSEITRELRYYEMIAKSSMLIGSFEDKDLMNDIIDLIYNYQESFEVTANVLETFSKIKSQIKYIKSYQPIKIALQYLKDGNYIAAIHHSNASIFTITEGKSELSDLDPKSVKMIMKARRIIKISLKKMGMISEAANISVSDGLMSHN